MPSVYNDQIGLVDLLEFNRQIEGMLTAGIPLTWRGDDSPVVLKTESERVASRAAVLVGQGSPFLEAWKAIPEISPTYEAAFMGWVLSNRSPYAFDLLKSNTTRLPQSRKLWFLNFQLGLVFLLALGVLAIWLSFGRLSLIYTDSHLEVGPISRFLETMQSQPVFAMVGGLVALLVWGIVLHLAKIRVAKLSQAMTARESRATVNWIKSQFMELVSSHTGNLKDADQFFESMVHERSANPPAEVTAEKSSDEQFAAPDVVSSNRSWLAPQGYMLWSAEKAVECRLAYRVSTLPYTIYFVGSGVVVLGIGVLIFGPLIELLYATLVPGAF
ncbi:MAG: hypothetical protein MUC43_08425 [Pirellula sp.]|jgi:hypothetical protein|nr:hypothetical protein [Pirellula sp.]